MKCPVCDGTTMREVEKNGVLIDICPTCKGVWLDRGELDKLMGGMREMKRDLEAWEQDLSAGRPSYDAAYDDYERRDSRREERPSSGSYDDKSRQEYDRKYGQPYRKKKRSMFDLFEDLFD